jgi:hypothetical protein
MFFCWYKWHGWPSLFTLSFHNIYIFCYLKKQFIQSIRMSTQNSRTLLNINLLRIVKTTWSPVHFNQ